ncbi:hypothetical protein D3C73_723980 [compost metagenome]
MSQGIQRIHNGFAPCQRQGIVQLRGVSIGGNGHHALKQHVAGIQALIHLHDGHARLRVARFNGALNRRRAAPARQQAGVDVQATQARQVQHPLRQDQAIGGHHHHVGRHLFQQRAGLGGFVGITAIQAQAARLGDGNAGVQRGLLDRAGRQLQATPGGTVGLGHHQGDLVTRGPQGVESDTGEFRRAGKN